MASLTRAAVFKKLEKAPPVDYYDLAYKLRGYLRGRGIKILDHRAAAKLMKKEDPEGKNPLPIGVFFAKDKAVWVHNNLYTDVYFKVMLHEVAHYTLGHTKVEGDYDLYIQELEAETTAGLVCEKLGALDLSQSAEYLQRKGLSNLGIPKASFTKIKTAANTLLKNCFNLPESELFK